MSKTVSAQLEHGRREAQLRATANRILASITWFIVCAGMALWFATFGVLASASVLHEPRIITYAYVIIAIACFVMSVVALLKGLDDLFYRKNDRRRLMGRRAND